jgi:hypothetical protein
MNKYQFSYIDQYGSIKDIVKANNKEEAKELAKNKISKHILLPLWEKNITLHQIRDKE